MPPYRHSDNVHLCNIIKMMGQHMHKQLFLHQHEIYIIVSHGRDATELQMHWQDYLTNTWCYDRFPFEFIGTNALSIYVNQVIKFFDITLHHATPFGDLPFSKALLSEYICVSISCSYILIFMYIHIYLSNYME